MSADYALKNRVRDMLIRDGFDKTLKEVDEIIIEKRHSSTQTYWREFKEELILQNEQA